MVFGPFLIAAWKFLKSIPWQVWVFAACMALAWLYGERRYAAGQDDVRKDWAEAVKRGKKEIERLKAERNKITVQTEKVYVDRIRVVREKGQTLIQRIPALVPADACVLPVGWRLSHDNAAAGTVPPASDGADATSGNAEAIAWRPWDSSAGAAGGANGGRKLLTRE